MIYETLKEEIRSAANQMTLDTIGRAIVGALTEAELKLLTDSIAFHANKVAMKI